MSVGNDAEDIADIAGVEPDFEDGNYIDKLAHPAIADEVEFERENRFDSAVIAGSRFRYIESS